MSVFKILTNTLLQLFKDKVILKRVDREDLRRVIKDNIKRHKDFETTLKRFSDKEINKFRDKYLDQIERCTRVPSCGVHKVYFKSLKGKAGSDENSRFLKSIQSANGDMADLLKEIEKNLSTIFQEQHLTIANVRITNISALGIIRQSEILATWSQFLWAQMAKLAVEPEATLPLYRVEYLNKHVQQVARIVSHMRAKTGPYHFMNELHQVRRKEADFILGISENGSGGILDMVGPNTFTLGFVENIESALSIMNIFRWSTEKWDDWQYTKNMKDRETLQWMEQHVALIKADMLGMSPSDPKYKKLKDVVNAYDAKISEYDGRIRRYEED